jgi:hypothetical protein
MTSNEYEILRSTEGKTIWGRTSHEICTEFEELVRNQNIEEAGKFCPLAHIKWKLCYLLPLHTQNW